MEQLRIRADRFRKQGRLQDKNLEEIISTIRAEEDFKCKKEEQQCNINGNGWTEESAQGGRRRIIAGIWHNAQHKAARYILHNGQNCN